MRSFSVEMFWVLRCMAAICMQYIQQGGGYPGAWYLLQVRDSRAQRVQQEVVIFYMTKRSHMELEACQAQGR